MGQIVASIISCPAPALFLRSQVRTRPNSTRTMDGMRRLEQILDETKPDALIVDDCKGRLDV